jgi:hypothetical protein
MLYATICFLSITKYIKKIYIKNKFPIIRLYLIDDNKVNYGIMKEVNGIVENHYVSIEVDSNS